MARQCAVTANMSHITRAEIEVVREAVGATIERFIAVYMSSPRWQEFAQRAAEVSRGEPWTDDFNRAAHAEDAGGLSAFFYSLHETGVKFGEDEASIAIDQGREYVEWEAGTWEGGYLTDCPDDVECTHDHHAIRTLEERFLDEGAAEGWKARWAAG